MRIYLGILIGGIALASAQTAWSDDTSTVMCKQFAIENAARTVEPSKDLDEVFSPPHHAPRNIPISVELPADTLSSIHFPIVEPGTYFVYATDAQRLSEFLHKDGTVIDTKKAPAPQDCSDVLTGGVIADLTEHPKGPVPIAISFEKGQAESIGLIISRDPIN